MPNGPSTGPLVVALLYDRLCTFEFGIVAEIFGLPRPEMGPHWYRFASSAVEPGPLRAAGGLTVTADAGPELLDRADLIVVPGWRGVDDPVPPDLLARLRAAHARGARLASICSGAFVLAATGLLEGGVATTHWRYADALRARHPGLTVDAASLYRAHDRIYTSAGSAAGLDLLIDIVRADFGPDAANSVARRLVLPAHRAGNQAQFLERPVPPARNGRIAPLLDQIRTDLAAAWSLDRMAETCAMSRRTFLRRFTEATGTAPGEWLLAERLAAARNLLATTPLPLDDVAATAGLGTSDTMRHHFRRHLGLSPRDYRRHFGPPKSGSPNRTAQNVDLPPDGCHHRYTGR